MGKCVQCTGCDSCNSACNSGQCYTCYSCQTDCQFCLICNDGCQTICELESQVLSTLENKNFAFSPAPTNSSTRIGPACSSNDSNIFSRTSWNKAAQFLSKRNDHGTLVNGGDTVTTNTTDTFFTADEFNRIARIVGWNNPVDVDDVIYASLFTTLESKINSFTIDATACDANNTCTNSCLSCNAACNTPQGTCQGCQSCVGCRGSCNTCNNGCSSCNKCDTACNTGENDCTETA